MPQPIKAEAFLLTARQCRLAWEALFKQPLPGDLSFVQAGQDVIARMGYEKGRAFLESF